MSTIISVYAKAGLSIPAHRLIRLTGNRNGALWEIDIPSALGNRSHAIALPGSSGMITDKVFGQACTFGPLVEVELAAAVSFDDELIVSADGRAQKARRTDRNRTAIALAKMGMGSVCPVLLGWSQLP